MVINASAEATVEQIEREYRQRTRRSSELFEAAERYIPGGASRGLVVYRPYPVCMAEGSGCRFTDVDGHEYVDFVNCNSALVHGHAHPGITAAIQRQAARSTAWSAASQEESDLAQLLCERVASIEKIRFCCSGTEGAMYAARIARAFTGRDKILKFEGGYHGSYDDVEMSKTFQGDEGGPQDDPVPVAATLGFPRGITDRVLVAPFNDREVAERRISEHSADLAAVIVEPVIGAGGMIPPEEGFLTFLRQATLEHGVVLIADEVVTFRLARGGAQELYGLKADLTMLGKVIGGGLPVAAIGGRADVLALTSYDSGGSQSKVSLSGTFSGAAIGMAAGKASLEALDAEAIARINHLGEMLRQQIRRALALAGVRGQVTGVGSLLQLHFADRPVKDYRAAVSARRGLLGPLHLWLLNHGIAMYPRGAFNCSTAMTEREIAHAAEVLGEGLQVLRPYIRSVAPELIGTD